MKSRPAWLGLSLAISWLFFTVCFAAWWFKLSFDHIARLGALEPLRMEHWERQQRMVIWEGSSWLLLLVVGGVALIALVLREKGRTRNLRQFFASFSHEIKTSLASLRLQTEALADELDESPILKRLVGDTVRLELQLENSLFLASQDELTLYVERLPLRRLIERTREQWPGLQIEVEADAVIRADERAARTLFNNLCKNAISHGQATSLKVVAKVATDPGQIEIRFEDNGQGFDGSLEELGQLFHRPKATSGSGLGLYISRLLVEKMGGELKLRAGNRGFHVDVILPGELA